MIQCNEPECVFYPAQSRILYRISPRDKDGVFLCGPHLREHKEKVEEEDEQ